MVRDAYRRATLAIAAAEIDRQGSDITPLSGEEKDLVVEYGQVLIALKHLVFDIQQESNAGNELCKDLIHQSLLPVLPSKFWGLFGYEE